MVPVQGLYQVSKGGSPYFNVGLENIQGTADEFQRPDFLVYADGATNDVPLLVCPGHLVLSAYYAGGGGGLSLNKLEIPYKYINKAQTFVGSNTLAKKQVTVTCVLDTCTQNDTFGVQIERIADPRFPVPSKKWYFDYEEGVPEDCTTNCVTRATIIANKINADPQSIVLATVTESGSGSSLIQSLVLIDKTDNADFRVDAEGFGSPVVNTNYGVVTYTVGKLREAYGPTFGGALADTIVLTATEIEFDRPFVVNGFAGTSSTASNSGETFNMQKSTVVVITNAANTNSAAYKTELDVILNGAKTPATLYTDRLC